MSNIFLLIIYKFSRLTGKLVDSNDENMLNYVLALNDEINRTNMRF